MATQGTTAVGTCYQDLSGVSTPGAPQAYSVRCDLEEGETLQVFYVHKEDQTSRMSRPPLQHLYSRQGPASANEIDRPGIPIHFSFTPREQPYLFRFTKTNLSTQKSRVFECNIDVNSLWPDSLRRYNSMHYSTEKSLEHVKNIKAYLFSINLDRSQMDAKSYFKSAASKVIQVSCTLSSQIYFPQEIPDFRCNSGTPYIWDTKKWENYYQKVEKK